MKTWPGVSYITRWRIPSADPDRFSVLVAHLEDDKNFEHENLIVEALKEFEGIQVLSLDRTIFLKGPVPEDREDKGHKEAQEYLQKSGATVLIWGSVLPLGGKAALKLYWTPAQEEMHRWNRYDSPRLEDQLRLPELFWTDLSEILRLLVVTRAGEFSAKDGHYIADQLPAFIARVRTLLQESIGGPGWDADARGATLVILGDALQVLGDQTGKSQALEEAVTFYRQALQELTRERVPLKWAEIQTHLGAALMSIGENENSIIRLEEAVASFRLALQEQTREQVPLDWAITQNNLGIALWRIGERERDTKHLKEAVAVYHQALQELTQERAPLLWARAHINLGSVLRNIGEREKDKAHMEEAVAAYREALKELNREQRPLDWALAQNNLGNALMQLGEKESGTDLLKQAVAAYRSALMERTRERVPLDWAMTQNNLGAALRILGEREFSSERLEQAVIAYKEALKERTKERVPLAWAGTMNNLGNALRSLGIQENDTSRLEESVSAYMGALKGFESAKATYYVDKTKGNLRFAEALIKERLNSKEK